MLEYDVGHENWFLPFCESVAVSPAKIRCDVEDLLFARPTPNSESMGRYEDNSECEANRQAVDSGGGPDLSHYCRPETGWVAPSLPRLMAQQASHFVRHSARILPETYSSYDTLLQTWMECTGAGPRDFTQGKDFARASLVSMANSSARMSSPTSFAVYASSSPKGPSAVLVCDESCLRSLRCLGQS
eukprot:TRINITY_DN83788_c0_g1_i1.p1 TRINITY_DN83788_c0_g1~~TRINITY_DN83788_c0_g1_i1.p1  ORF type:complete len:187 (+),score=17.40 TRINITY_DN83788_c0_g1_i1:13-573(+)